MTHASPFHFHIMSCLLRLESWSQTAWIQVLL